MRITEAIQSFKNANESVSWTRLVGQNRPKEWSIHKWTLIGKTDSNGQTNWTVENLSVVARLYYFLIEKSGAGVFITTKAILPVWNWEGSADSKHKSVKNIFESVLSNSLDEEAKQQDVEDTQKGCREIGVQEKRKPLTKEEAVKILQNSLPGTYHLLKQDNGDFLFLLCIGKARVQEYGISKLLPHESSYRTSVDEYYFDSKIEFPFQLQAVANRFAEAYKNKLTKIGLNDVPLVSIDQIEVKLHAAKKIEELDSYYYNLSKQEIVERYFEKNEQRTLAFTKGEKPFEYLAHLLLKDTVYYILCEIDGSGYFKVPTILYDRYRDDSELETLEEWISLIQAKGGLIEKVITDKTSLSSQTVVERGEGKPPTPPTKLEEIKE